jgi:hypothetical protein
MHIIKAECVDNARGMLEGPHSQFLGWIGNVRYYLCDGKVWSVCGGTIARSDDADESEVLRLTVKFFNAETLNRR